MPTGRFIWAMSPAGKEKMEEEEERKRENEE
jgi:hypothetical protein